MQIVSVKSYTDYSITDNISVMRVDIDWDDKTVNSVHLKSDQGGRFDPGDVAATFRVLSDMVRMSAG